MKPRRLILLTLFAFGVTAVAAFLLVGLPPLRPTTTGGVVEIEMTTQQWRFDVVRISPEGVATASSIPPSGAFADTRIVVPKGTTVILHIRNLDVPHGFGLEEFGIVNQLTPPDQVTTVRFVASESGEFVFFCTVFCGTGHPNHKGTLVVTG